MKRDAELLAKARYPSDRATGFTEGELPAGVTRAGLCGEGAD